jgi:hypothetical protein
MSAVDSFYMRLLALLILIAVHASLSFAQDGSDMNYVKTINLDRSYVGRKTHIDFYRISRGSHRDKAFNIDNVLLEIDGKQIEFVEHREDDGYNNWFKEQYLESIDKRIRITEFKLLGIGKDTVSVTAYFTVAPYSKDFTFKKSDIAQFLFKAIRTN